MPYQNPLVWMQRYGLFCLCLAQFLSACNSPEYGSTSVTEQVTARADTSVFATDTTPNIPTTDILTSPVPLSLTVPPSPTLNPESTSTSTRRSMATPTFDVATTLRRTPPRPAQCPITTNTIPPDLEYSAETVESVGRILEQVLEYLNAGGARSAVITAYRLHDPKSDESVIQETDVTGDGVPELLLTDSDAVVAYVCEDGHYIIKALPVWTYHYGQPLIIAIQDMNLDGVKEAIAIAGDERIRLVSVIEWDGRSFQSLVEERTCSTLYGPSWAETQDVDGNGTLELVLRQEIPIWSEYVDGLPWRKETRTCAWNGRSFVLTHTETETPPEYRFQATQDGDRASLAGDYDAALDLYKQAIFDKGLEWWSLDRRIYEMNTEGYRPTPIPSLAPDPAEYPVLAAYARFRMMLIYTIRGDLSQAEVVYQTLQATNAQGQIGHAYAEMASVFQDEYQRSSNVGLSCSKAIEYATEHAVDILAYLGNSEYALVYFGDQSLVYKPEDVCPVR